VVGTTLEMCHPLFTRYIIDQVLLSEGVSRADRLARLNLVGLLFLGTIAVGQSLGATRSLRQRILNARVVLSLRRALMHRLLHLPLQTLSDMKTGGILSRLSNDVGTTTGLLQLAIISPS